jgi:hypothetical protein
VLEKSGFNYQIQLLLWGMSAQTHDAFIHFELFKDYTHIYAPLSDLEFHSFCNRSEFLEQINTIIDLQHTLIQANALLNPITTTFDYYPIIFGESESEQYNAADVIWGGDLSAPASDKATYVKLSNDDVQRREFVARAMYKWRKLKKDFPSMMNPLYNYKDSSNWDEPEHGDWETRWESAHEEAHDGLLQFFISATSPNKDLESDFYGYRLFELLFPNGSEDIDYWSHEHNINSLSQIFTTTLLGLMDHAEQEIDSGVFAFLNSKGMWDNELSNSTQNGSIINHSQFQAKIGTPINVLTAMFYNVRLAEAIPPPYKMVHTDGFRELYRATRDLELIHEYFADWLNERIPYVLFGRW